MQSIATKSISNVNFDFTECYFLLSEILWRTKWFWEESYFSGQTHHETIYPATSQEWSELILRIKNILNELFWFCLVLDFKLFYIPKAVVNCTFMNFDHSVHCLPVIKQSNEIHAHKIHNKTKCLECVTTAVFYWSTQTKH